MKKQEFKNIVRLAGIVEEIEETEFSKGKIYRIRIGYHNKKYEHECYDCFIEDREDLSVGDSIQLKGHLDVEDDITYVVIDTFIKLDF